MRAVFIEFGHKCSKSLSCGALSQRLKEIGPEIMRGKIKNHWSIHDNWINY